MQTVLTKSFIERMLRLDYNHKATYSVEFLNIEVTDLETNQTTFISIQEFIRVHVRDFLSGYSNGLEVHITTKRETNNSKIAINHFKVSLTVPNLLETSGISHTEMFFGVSELKVFVDAAEWLIQYRDANKHISKFWISGF